jgi:hypothetical protein
MTRRSNYNPLDLIQADLIAPAITELSRARRGVVCHRRSFFEGAAILEIGRDPGCPETVVAELGCNAGRCGAPADHRIGVRLRQRCAKTSAKMGHWQTEAAGCQAEEHLTGARLAHDGRRARSCLLTRTSGDDEAQAF